ncbi:MAG: pantetheine-phosphate adenylyltransferase [Eubacteriaceae bacterium]|jgi:pantetheine-phosphate adenylyltransferase|nr:pantetheine-phosphate adenylyltransferase [Eubacteriaceae bacterium]MDD4507520.1 pantetheine-phosphate adenylyltransferase [Eubacteriaceae bacterium]
MTIAVYPGSFDPVTLGHVDVIKRASRVFEEVRVCVMKNPKKHYLFSEKERLAFLTESTKQYSNVMVDAYQGLLTEYVRAKNARVVIKGLRSSGDFEYEKQMDFFNKRLAPEVETLYMAADNAYSVLSSSAIRELMTFGGSLDGLVPEVVLDAAAKRMGGKA